MKTIKIIDLLNKIANGEEVPKGIYFNGFIWKYDVDNNSYRNGNNSLFGVLGHYKGIILNDEIKIIEDTPKEDNKINKIRVDYNSINIDKVFEMGSTTFFRKDIEIFQCLSSKINEIIDYLKSKGDE